jgi:SWI/SNF-related matrix-associated actin-dependent regulator of chromatin subfamily A member 5
MIPSEALAAAEKAWAEKENDLESSKLEAELRELELSEEEKNHKALLISQGFSNWSKRDFKCLVAALERHGRSNLQAVFNELLEVTDSGKTLEEIQKYYNVFTAKCETYLTDWKKIKERIERGEARLKRREAMELLVAEKVASTPDPYRTLPISYGSKGNYSRGFSEEEDRFLLCQLNSLGYGAWDALVNEIRSAEQFRFNWFMKSRPPAELQRRCDALVRLLEKEAGSDVISNSVDITGANKKRARPSIGAQAALPPSAPTPAATAVSAYKKPRKDVPA